MAATTTISNVRAGPTLDFAKQSGTTGALVMGADYRGLGVVRSLGRRGIPVWIIKEGGHLVAATSRYVLRREAWPPGDENRKIEFLLDLANRHDLNGWMLLPTDDYNVALVSQFHEILTSKYRVTVPPWKELRWACDKRMLCRLACKLGIHQPWTAWPSCREEIGALDYPFPVILKPSVRLWPNSLSIPKAWRVNDYATLLARYDEACALVPPEGLMVQEIVPGEGETQFSYSALCRDGDPVASVVARRTRQYPRDFGRLSTYVETVDEPQVIEPSVRLLKAIRFTGLVEVEFKKDARTGEYKILDVNPRVWGWHTLSKRAGVDFPYLLWLLAKGEHVPQVRGRAGERWMYVSGDLPVAIQEILSGRLTLRSYIGSLLRPFESAIFAWDDPVPGLFDLPLITYTLGKRVLCGKGSNAVIPSRFKLLPVNAKRLG